MQVTRMIAALCALVATMLPGCGSMTEKTRREIVDVAKEAERDRTGEGGDWVHIVVEADDSSRSLGVRFYRAYNSAVDPAWIYILATDEGGAVYRIGGFKTSDYPRLAQRWMRGAGRISDAAATEVVSLYFKYVEQWRPGVVRRQRRSLPMENARRCGAVFPVVRGGGADRLTVSAVLFDEISSGMECVQVDLSQAKGLVVSSRRVIVPRERIEM